MKKVNYRHWICLGITLVFVSLAILLFPNAFGRLMEGFVDVGTSVAYCFEILLYGKSDIVPTVTALTSMPFELPFDLPNTFEEFQQRLSLYWEVFFDLQTVDAYLDFLTDVLVYVCYFILYAMPLLLIIVLCKLFFGNSTNNNYNVESKPLRAWKKACKRFYAPLKRWVLDFLHFVKQHWVWWLIWLIIWGYNFNVITIALCFVAYYIYLVASLDLISMYQQVVKLLMDLSVAIDFVPLIVWLLFGYIVLDKIRRKIGYSRLEHMELCNRGFINERPILALVCGTMGKKKTTTVTDMALSQEIMFRDKAFELLLQADLKFPYFPWINFELTLKRAIARHEVYNLATCRKWVGELQSWFWRGVENPQYAKYFARYCSKRYGAPWKNLLFDYDFNRYGFDYDNSLEVVDIWKVLEDYAQLYFIYVIQSSIIVSNYSIRTDNVIDDIGNFPLWHTELFKRNSRMMDAYSRHSHILDFDALRLGKKVVADNKYANVFEFGVVVVTEIGKERGNSIELQGKKKDAEETNQKNDLFNSWLKMCRHSATVCNFPFIKIISDEQRPSSWGADAVDLCEIVYIKETSETRLAMPLFALGGLVFDWEVDNFKNNYSDFRYRRGDNTLLMYLWKGLTQKINDFKTKIYNTFGYCKLDIQVESGTRDGLLDDKTYYLMFKKIYSRRFATDCYSDFYAQKALSSLVGLEDLPCYESVRATVQEFLQQNSYFMAELLIGLLKNNCTNSNLD